MGVELLAHPTHLGVGLGLHIGEQLRLASLEGHGVVQPFAAEVGASGIVGVVDPDSGRLVFDVQGDELYIKQREEVASATLFTPFPVSVQ